MRLRSLTVTQQRVILILLGVVIFGAGLGLRDPWPADEPRFALVAKEMVETGEWLIPHRAGEIYADKPPVFFWMIAVLYAITGSIRISFLIPALLAGLGALLLIHDLALRLWTKGAAFITALALLSSVQFVMQARSGQIDGVLVFWTTLGLYGICRHLFTGPAKRWWYIGFAAAGAGVITKGVGFLPLLLLIPAGFTKLRRTYSWKMIGAGFLVTLGVIALWLVPMVVHVAASGDPELIAYRDNILLKQTGQRYAAAWHHFAWPGYFLFEVVPWAWLPLTLLLPWTIPAFWRRFRSKDERVIVLIGWVLLVLLFFSLSKGKRGVYILPALPAFVLAHGGMLRALLARPAVLKTLRAATAVVTLLLIAVIVALAVRPELLEKGGIQGVDASALALVLLVPAICGVILSLLPKEKSPLAIAALLAIVWISAGWGVLPPMNEDRSSSAFMRTVEQQIGPHSQLGILAWREQFALQSTRTVVTFGYGRSDMDAEAKDGARWLVSGRDRSLLVTDKHAGACFDRSRLVPLEERSRHRWYLARPDAVVSRCR